MIEKRDLEAILDAVSEVTKAYIAAEVGKVRSEMPPTLDMEKFRDSILAMVPQPKPIDIEAIAERAAALIPKPKDGRDGSDGKDAPQVDTGPIVAAVLRDIPPVFNGRDGKDGENGKDGKDGRDGIDGKDGAVGPQGERGMDGESLQGPAGPQGERGLPGESIQGPKGDAGERGMDGKDAVLPDLEPIVHRAFDVWFSKYGIDVERRAHDMFQRAIDQMPTPKDGKDGIGPEDFTFEDDGRGRVTWRVKRGDFERSGLIRIPCLDDRGVFAEGETYQRGDGVSFGGSFWIAQKDNPSGKPGNSGDWRLAVKKGRDGKDGVKPPPEGPVKL